MVFQQNSKNSATLFHVIEETDKELESFCEELGIEQPF